MTLLEKKKMLFTKINRTKIAKFFLIINLNNDLQSMKSYVKGNVLRSQKANRRLTFKKSSPGGLLF